MSKLRHSSYSSTHFFSTILILSYLSIGFVPNWGAVDKIAPQWLVLSCINLLSSIYVLIDFKKFKLAIENLLTSFIALFYISFFLWALGSYLYAINPTEALVNLPRHANTLFMMIYLFLFLFQFSNNFKLIILWVITIILGIEIFSVLSQAQEIYFSTGKIDSGQLKGIAANRNITAFSIVVKLPFLLFLLDDLKKTVIKLFALILLTLSVFSITIIASRASFIALLLVSLSYIGLFCYEFFIQKRKSLQKVVFIIAPIFLGLLLNQFIFSSTSGSANVVSRAASIKVDGSDNSINQRLRYYEDVIKHIQHHPFIGVGIGNWKIKSIDYDKKDIKGYVVPYHAHSDFIQLGAELGILGFLLYLGVFFSAVFMGYKIIVHKSIDFKEKAFIFMMLAALGVYFIDANLNFPIARPQVLYTLTLILSIIGVNYKRNFTSDVLKVQKYGVSLPIIGILLFIPSISITNTTYKSLKAQMLILQDFNSNKYNLPLNQIESFIPPIPNITVTTIPMDAIKARYYFHYKKYDMALAYSEKAKKANPYLRFPEILQSQIYAAKGEYEKAWEASKIAFENLPSNTLHLNQFLNLSSRLKKRDAIKEAFPLITLNNIEENWKNYLVVVSQLFPSGEEPFVSQSAQAVKYFPNNKQILNLHHLISIGKERINQAGQYSKQGLNYFNLNEYTKAAEAFEKAMKFNPMDYAHFENAATSNYLIGNLEKALDQINIVINQLNPLNGKCEYIKALIYIRMGDQLGACPLLLSSKDSGYDQANATFKQFCK